MPGATARSGRTCKLEPHAQAAMSPVEQERRLLSSTITAIQIVIYDASRLADLIEQTLGDIAAGNWRAACDDVVNHGTRLSRLFSCGPDAVGHMVFAYLAGEEIVAMQKFVTRAEAWLQRRAQAEAARWPADEARAALDTLRARI